MGHYTVVFIYDNVATIKPLWTILNHFISNDLLYFMTVETIMKGNI